MRVWLTLKLVLLLSFCSVAQERSYFRFVPGFGKDTLDIVNIDSLKFDLYIYFSNAGVSRIFAQGKIGLLNKYAIGRRSGDNVIYSSNERRLKLGLPGGALLEKAASPGKPNFIDYQLEAYVKYKILHGRFSEEKIDSIIEELQFPVMPFMLYDKNLFFRDYAGRNGDIDMNNRVMEMFLTRRDLRDVYVYDVEGPLLWKMNYAERQKSKKMKAVQLGVKIYVTDAETGKNVADAKVKLEGTDVTPVEGRYDKKGSYYYFKQVPSGYNTVMVYHKKYNEKGFQDVNGLPGEIKLKLSTPYRVRVGDDTLNYYKEENDKILVAFSDTLYNATLNCPGDRSAYMCFVNKYFEEHYPELVLKGKVSLYFSMGPDYFYLTKRNRKNFKRFNDPVIGRLNADSNILFVNQLLLKTKEKTSGYFGVDKEFFFADGRPNYVPGHFKYIGYDTSAISDYEKGQFSNRDRQTVKLNILLTHRELMRRGLVPGNIYTLTRPELDIFYKQEEETVKKTGLYHYKIMNDTSKIIFNDFYDGKIEEHYIPYILISTSLFNPETGMDTRSKRSAIILHYNNHKENIPVYDKSIILEKHTDNKFIYVLKGTASPFGVMDMVKYYRSAGKAISQTIEKNVTQPE